MSKKNYDNHNCWRNKTVAFRVSAEEYLQLETLVKLTGLTKQDYIIRRLWNRDVVVQGNPKVYKACGISCLPCWTSCADRSRAKRERRAAGHHPDDRYHYERDAGGLCL